MNAAPAPCAENRHSLSDKLVRIRALETAGSLVGLPWLADTMSMPVRTLRSYASVERRMPEGVLGGAAAALEARADEILKHAARLRALAGEAK